ncbi:hypothetical protein Vi05172_g8547 [Venturia inaequalis]|nr:hypothetical protein Vi05172_g8547 [Venturia inaequalis]
MKFTAVLAFLALATTTLAFPTEAAGVLCDNGCPRPRYPAPCPPACV